MLTARSFAGLMAVLAAALVGWPSSADAHCDTLNGPVVSAARNALQAGDVTPVLKWVKPPEEAEVRDAFQRTVAVRRVSPEARELADLYFFETLVRLHRQGEGEPYTGLKPADEVEPSIEAADRALESGSVDQLVKLLSDGTAAGIHQRFALVRARQSRADVSVAAGREYVEAYVEFVHYVEQLHLNIAGATAGTEHHR